MSGEFTDGAGLSSEFEVVEKQLEEQKQIVTPVEEEVPEKYRNKTAAELAKMHQEAERLLGRQAQEVGEIRKLADQLIKERLQKHEEPKPQPVNDELTDVDFFADPVKAVNKAVEKHPAVLGAKLAAAEMRKREMLNRLTSVHPDYQQVGNDPEFKDWVSQSRIRQTLYNQANNGFDVEAANELLSTFKQLRQKRAETVNEGAAEIKKENERALKAVSAPTGGSGETSKKIYRRPDLIRLQITDPDRYMALQDEILTAYAEGRVR